MPLKLPVLGLYLTEGKSSLPQKHGRRQRIHSKCSAETGRINLRLLRNRLRLSVFLVLWAARGALHLQVWEEEQLQFRVYSTQR